MRKRYQTTPKEKREEILVAYLTGENSVEELANYYKVNEPVTVKLPEPKKVGFEVKSEK